MAALEELLVHRCNLILKPQLAESKLQAGFIQDAQHDLFPVMRRERRNTKIKDLSVDPQRHPAILRRTLLGDIQIGHNLNTTNQRGLDIFRDTGTIRQNAIYAVAHPNALFIRLDVDITGLFRNPALQNRIRKLNNRLRRGI